MARLAKVFLCNLQFHHVGRLPNLVEHGAVGLTGLEVQGTVLGLEDDIVTELTIQRLELRHGLLDAVFALVVGTIDKAAPHDDAFVGLQGIGQHIGSVGMRAVVVARTGLSLAVGLDQEASKVRYQFVYFLGLLFPPLGYRLVQRVSRLGVAQCHGCGEVDAEVNLDAIGSQDVGYLPDLFEIGCGQHLG